ncbi:MAG: hypothetical protein DRR08_20055 [Candidatus Parabeggiatoa sp. nov. 2]|nr:MAG: hypothetical protein B6247_08245 [Beggiatoa sp. 4572_84]RKZ57059.1 MAG: hypothetical protein DRR08_20055 [Gammaproteobacteria bacterium]
MTNSHFNNSHYRFFFIYGQIYDQFCPPTLGFLDFSKMLHRHLRQLDYQRIVFYNSGAQKIDTYDNQSTALVRPNAAPQQQTPRRATKISAGPLGQRRQSKKPAPKPQTAPLDAINNLDAVASFDRWMKESQPKTALIFTNGLDFITHFDQAAQRQMSVALDNWNQLFEENKNICIFLLSGISVQRLRELPELQRQWFFLFNQMFKDDNTPTEQMIPIGAPRQDEVNNLLNYWRLKYELPTDWRIFPTAAAPITRYLCNQGGSIKSLIRNLKKLNRINKEALSELAGQSEQGSALERLHQMKGLSIIANRIERMVTHHQNQIASNSQIATTNTPHTTVSRLLPPPPSPAKGRNLHLALKGNPGTGKTTVARLIGEIYREEGLLELGQIVKASREDLVAGYIGQTALKTAQKIADAIGGILFVDEAYRLTQGGDNDFGKEAVETIMEAMENHKGEFAVIIAGYPQRIEDFLQANPGLHRRFSDKNTLTIPDYDPQTLQLIFEQQIAQQKRQLHQTLQEKLPNFFANWHAERNEETFGNAGDVLNLYDEMDEQRSFRLKDQTDNSNRFTLTEADVPERLSPYLEPRQPENMDDILKSLDHLIGLQQVKETIQTLVNRLKVQKLRGDKSQLNPGHYLFVGNPGTGKTTVARLMGNIFKALGILKKGHLIEVGRADLVGQYQGHTAEKTRQVLERSLDGVLFIDEAYQLVTNEHDSFGKEALETLVATMENQRHRLCIIAAGYPQPMHRFVNSNPGLPSRFAGEIVFENYTATEMLSILKGMVLERSLTLGEGIEEALLPIFRQWERENSPTFGNGREVRNLLEAACARLDNRLVEEKVTDKALLYRLERLDIQD